MSEIKIANDLIPFVIKDPDEELDYIVDFAPLTNSRDGAESDWLASGETLLSKTVTGMAGITIDSDAFIAANTAVVIWLSGGNINFDYDIDVVAQTSGLRTVSRSFRVKVRNR